MNLNIFDMHTYYKTVLICDALSKNVLVGHANFKSSLERHTNSNSKNVWEDQYFMTLLSTRKMF